MLIQQLRPIGDDSTRTAFGLTKGGLALSTVAVTAALMLSTLGIASLEQSERVKERQVTGAPPQVCLLDFFKATVPSPPPDLKRYEVLQEARYRDIVCPGVSE